MMADQDHWLNPGDNIILGPGGYVKPGSATVTKLGSPADTFRYFVPRSAIASRPAAAAGVVGLLWATREAGNKEMLWVCMRNDADGYEWVQVGITT